MSYISHLDGSSNDSLRATARKLDDTAMGGTYFAEALRAAVGLDFLEDRHRVVLKRYLNGTANGVDHLTLQEVSIKIREHDAKTRAASMQVVGA